MEFTVDSKGGHFAPPDYGISLSVPPDAVLPGKIQKISIRPCVSVPFKYHEGYELLSAVYLITPKVSFEKKVELRLDHYGRLETDEQASQITFLSAKKTLGDVNEKRMFEFRPLKDGKFAVHETYGTLQLKHFCPVGVGVPKNSETSKQWLLLYLMNEIFHCCGILN